MDESITVLYVDDETYSANETATVLEREVDRLTVEAATSVRDGVEYCDGENVDCVVSSYDLGHQTGLDFLETIRRRYPKLPFILYTGTGSEEIASDAISADVTEYLRKETEPDQHARLLTTIENIVDGDSIESESEIRPRRVYERITDGFFAVNSDWRYTYVNEEGARLVDRSKDDLLGERIWEVFPEIVETVFEETLRTAMDTQETISSKEYYPAHDTWYDVTVYPADNGGGISIYFRDITDHKERNRQFEAIFNNTHTFVGLLQPDGTLLEANETALSFGGLDREDVVGKPVWEGDWFESNETVQTAVRDGVEQARNGELFRDEIRVQGADREAVIDFTIRPITNERGDVTRLVPEGRDITERKQYVRRLETLIDNLPGMVYRCENEPGWPMETIRGEVEALTGYSSTALETRDGRYGTEIIHPDDRESAWEITQEALDDREPFELTYRIVTKDGTTKWLWERGQGIYSMDGDVRALEGFITEITERKEITQKLREERDFIDQALDSLDDIFYVVGTDGEISRWNSRLAEVTGYTDDEISGMQATAFFPTEDRERISDAIEEALTTGSAVVESELLTADGTRIPYEFTGARLTDTEGELAGLVGIGRDVTTMKERERTLDNQREHLAALNSLNTVLRDVTDAVIEQSTREEIERVACEKLADSNSYSFAWVAESEPGTNAVIPRTERGAEGYVEWMELSTEDDQLAGQNPVTKTFRTGETSRSGNVFEETAFESVREPATEYGFSSFVTVPIVHEQTQYGVLGIHSERTDAFAVEEQEIVTQLGEIIGYALYALERKEMLGSAMELTFRSEQIAQPFLDQIDEDSEFTLEAVVPLDEDDQLQYWTISGIHPKLFQRAIEELPPIEESRLLSTIEGSARFEVSVGAGSISSIFTAFDGTFQSATFDDHAFTVVGEFPETADPETIIETLRDTYSDAELVSQQRVLTPRYLRQMVNENLTDRQQTVLQMAYFGSYFDRPRLSTGEELAENLGITKQTFHHHLRNAESTVFELLFEEPGEPLI